MDLRIIVINQEVVAAAVRKPAEIMGTGRHTVRELLERVSRRRNAATGGESSIPQDDETERCIAAAGFSYDDILPDGYILQVRRTANLHTGGTIHDVTPQLSPTLRAAAVEAARALEIPVVGLDFLVPSVEGDDYVIIEANERPGPGQPRTAADGGTIHRLVVSPYRPNPVHLAERPFMNCEHRLANTCSPSCSSC